MPEISTRDRLLDATEQLVAMQGYANTSLREITTKAEVNLAAVNYHFGSKDGLVAEMLTRRLGPLNAQRLSMLEAELKAAENEGRRPGAETLMRIFIEPALAFFQSGESGQHFLRIFSRIHSDPDDTIRQEFLKHMAPVFMSFFAGFQKALPKVPPHILSLRMFFCIGALANSASHLVDEDFRDKGPKLGIPIMPDADTVVEELLGFVLRGMEAK